MKMPARATWRLVPLLFMGCLSSEDVARQIRTYWDEQKPALLKPLKDENAALRTQIEELRAATLCSPELRQLISIVDKEGCTTPSPSQQAVASCPPSKINNLLQHWDPHTRRNLLKLINRQQHTYVFFGRETQIFSYRQRKLEVLARDKVNDNTRFLVLGRIDPKEKEAGEVHANERTQAVVTFLRDSGVAAERVVSWNLAFLCALTDIPFEDQPVPRVDGDGTLNRMVVVFRVDC